MSLVLAAVMAACGSGGGGGGKGSAPLPLTVAVEDAPIVGVLVQDRDGQPGAQTAFAVIVGGIPTGRYTFESTPVLPIRVTSQNLQSPDGQFKVAFVDGSWWSYEDTNGDNAYNAGDRLAPLSFQDLDGNGLYSQSVDVLYNGKMKLNFVPDGAREVRANIVASLIPSGWNGQTAVAGLSPAVLTEAATVGPTQSESAVLKQTTAVLTAISEALVATGAVLRDNLANVVTAVAAAPTVNLTSTGAAATAALAQVVAAAVVPAQAQAAQNITTNIQSIVDTATTAGTGTTTLTSNFEAIVKVAQANASTLAQSVPASGSQTVQTLANQTVTASQQIALEKETAVVGLDPETARVASMRLFPWLDIALIERGEAVPDDFAFRAVGAGRTTGFSLERTSDGSIRLQATGEPFGSALGASLANGNGVVNLPFVPASGQWRLLQGEGAQQQGVLVDLKSGFEDPQSKAYVPGAMLRVCLPQGGGCWPFMLATQQQICSLLNGGAFASNPARRSSALSALQGVNASAVNCP